MFSALSVFYLKQLSLHSCAHVTTRLTCIWALPCAWDTLQASACGVPLVCGAGPHPSTRLEGMIGGEGASEAAMMAQVKVRSVDFAELCGGGSCVTVRSWLEIIDCLHTTALFLLCNVLMCLFLLELFLSLPSLLTPLHFIPCAFAS